MFSDRKEEAGTILLALTLPLCHLETGSLPPELVGWYQGDHPPFPRPTLRRRRLHRVLCWPQHNTVPLGTISTFPFKQKQVPQHYSALNHSLQVGIHREQENKVLAFQPPKSHSELQKPCYVCFPTVQGKAK